MLTRCQYSVYKVVKSDKASVIFINPSYIYNLQKWSTDHQNHVEHIEGTLTKICKAHPCHRWDLHSFLIRYVPRYPVSRQYLIQCYCNSIRTHKAC